VTDHVQGEFMDRRKWLDETTPVTDDPRMVPTVPGPKGPESSIVVTGGRVLDGTGAPARDATLVIERNKITGVLPPGSSEWPADARVIDVKGKTVMPGLVDLHCHLTFAEANEPVARSQSLSDATLRGIDRMWVWLQSGITTLRDAGSHAEVPFRLKEWVSKNRLPGPRIFAAGNLITGTGGHGAEHLSPTSPMLGVIREASGPDDWRNAAREQFKKGADIIKIASHFSRDELAAVVDEAHTLGLKVMCDAETHYIQWAVEAGVDTIEHPLPRTDECIALMAERGVDAVPTVVAYLIIFDRMKGYFGSTSRRFTFSKEANVEMLRRLRRAGVRMGIGTDVIFDDYRMFPAPYITELKLFVEAGFSINEALVAATKTGAEILGMDHLLGTLEPGKLADVLVVNGRPDDELDDLANVDLVIRDGYVVLEDGRIVVNKHTPTPMPVPEEARGEVLFE